MLTVAYVLVCALAVLLSLAGACGFVVCVLMGVELACTWIAAWRDRR